MPDLDTGIVSAAPAATATQEPTKEAVSTPEGGNTASASEIQETQINWEKRYRDSSSEVNKWKTEAEQTKAELEAQRQELLSTVTKSREDFEEYIDSKVVSPQDKEYYMNIYDTRIAPGKGTQASQGSAATEVTDKLGGTPSPSAATAPQDPIRAAWMNRMDEQEISKHSAQLAASRDFLSKEENKNLPKAIQRAIFTTAEMLDMEYGFEPAEALATARKRILNPEDIGNEGYVQGVRDMYEGVSRGVSGGSSKGKETVKLPEKDEAFIQAEINRKGLKGEEAENLRTAYARQLAKRQ